jgi:UDP-2-acetamido-3-amino-2,3-dideoxy-glucuronate N-acetyltransferase
LVSKTDVRVALIGCGYWGKNHARVLNELVENVTYCDESEELLKSVSDKYPGHSTSNVSESVITDPNIDAVILATPAVTHYTMAKRILESGKHVLVEKPLALTFEQGKALVDVAEANDRILMVGHVMRYHPAVAKLVEMVTSGELGDLRYVYSNRLNLGKVRLEENALWSFAPHDVSIMLALTGQLPTQVSCVGGDYLNNGISDVTLSSLTFSGGVQGHIFVSWLHPYKEQKLVVVGSSGMASFDDTLPKDKLLLYNHPIEYVDGGVAVERAEATAVEYSSGEPLMEEDLHFIRCIENGTRPLTDGVEGLGVLNVLGHCQKSLDLDGAPQNLILDGVS